MRYTEQYDLKCSETTLKSLLKNNNFLSIFVYRQKTDYCIELTAKPHKTVHTKHLCYSFTELINTFCTKDNHSRDYIAFFTSR